MTTVATLERERQAALTLQELADELLRQQETKKDYVVDTRRMSFSTDPIGGETRRSTLTFDVGTEVDGGPVNEHAARQLGERVGIPRPYFKRMFAEAPGLLDANVQHWLHNQPEKRMVRMLDGNVRALLSNTYRRLDNLDLMERAVIPVLQDYPGLTFQKAALDTERLYIRALLPTLERELKVGDTVQAAVQIRNSEVGSGLFEVTPVIWRLDCLNGMVVPIYALKKRHIGSRILESDEMLKVFSEETLAADDAAFFLKARDLVRASLTEALFDEIIEQLRDSVSGREIEQAPAATEVLSTTFSLTKEEGGSVLTALAAGGDLTKWGAANAITAAAKKAATFQRQEELERVGWEVATMPTGDWERVALARA